MHANEMLSLKDLNQNEVQSLWEDHTKGFLSVAGSVLLH